LGKDSPYDNLESSIRWPPVLMTIASEEQAIDFG